MTVGDRIAVLDGGRLQQVGTPLECYYEPANRFVAGFIGEPSMNFLDCTLNDGVLRHDTFEYELANAAERSTGTRRRVSLGIRPEDIEAVRDGDTGVQGPVLDATVTVVEPMGNVAVFSIEVGTRTLTASTTDRINLTAAKASRCVYLSVRFTYSTKRLARRSEGLATPREETPARGSSSS